REDAMPTIKRILCPIDFSDTAAVAAREAAALARAAGAELLLLHVLHEPFMAGSNEPGYRAPVAQQYEMIVRRKLDAAASSLRVLAKVRTLLVHGQVEDAIAQAANRHGADVIVMGTRSRKGLQRILGDSMTERVMRKSRVPVVRVSPAEIRRPSMPHVSPHGTA
ncbi:MAG TPA: universal stress protein, partial [Polyangiales bacterium]